MKGMNKDLTNEIFGKLTVLYYVGNSYWMCRCDCENKTEKPIKTAKLNNGHTKSCGCIKHNHPPNFIDLTGLVFGKLIVLSYNGDRKWLCQCDCPNKTQKLISTQSLNKDKISSCGCVKKVRTNCKSKTKEYSTYHDIKRRCYNKKNKDYKYYGGRGIFMCDEWKNSYDNFLQDMGKCPEDKDSIDRIDVNGDYTPENCRWATNKEQANNNRRNRLVTLDGITMNITQWCEKLNISTATIYYRIYNGWSDEEALTDPIRKTNNKE